MTSEAPAQPHSPNASPLSRAAQIRAMTDSETRLVLTTEGGEGLLLCTDESEANAWAGLRGMQSARDLQQWLLPNRCPRLMGYSIAATSTPAQDVGGDHYNFLPAGGSYLGLMMADVSGKGMAAARLAAALRATFRTQAWGNHDVRNVLARVNAFLLHCLGPGHFITCTYGILDPPRRLFTFARAGHEPLLLARNGRVELLRPDGFPLGILPEPEFSRGLQVVTLALEPHDRLLIFTDGLTEAMNWHDEEFGMDRIIETMTGFDSAVKADHSNTHSLANTAAGQIHHMENAAARFISGAPPHDDISLLCLAVNGKSE